MPLSNQTIFFGCLPFIVGLVWMNLLNRRVSTFGQHLLLPIGATAVLFQLFLLFGVLFWLTFSTNGAKFNISISSTHSDGIITISPPPPAIVEASNFARTPMGIFLFCFCLYYWIKTCRRINADGKEAKSQIESALKPPIPEP